MLKQESPKICVWLSRHTPTPAQRKSLPGYTIHQLNPPGRFFGAVDAWVMVQNSAFTHGGLDLIVVVMPFGMQKHFLELVGSRAPVVRAVFDYGCQPPRFVGWKQLVAVEVVERDWTPECEVQP